MTALQRALGVFLVAVLGVSVTASAPVAALQQPLPSADDWLWFNQHESVVLERFMPMRRDDPFLVRYRLHNELYPDREERYFSIVPAKGADLLGPLVGIVVVPDGQAIRWQVLTGHMKDSTASIDSLLSRVSVRRVVLESTTCPALRAAIETLPPLAFDPFPSGSIVLHAPTNAFEIDIGGVRASATVLSGDETPLLRWTRETEAALLACAS